LSRRTGLVRRLLPAAIVALCACARIAPPSGGPEDREAPRLTGHAPDSAEVRVALDRPVSLCFSERMDRAAARDWLLIAPWPGRLECVWEQTCMVCAPAAGWSGNTTYTILLGANAADRHGNKLAGSIDFAFSTGDSLARGRIAGEVRTRALPRDAVPVYIFDWPASTPLPPAGDTSLRPDLLSARRIAQTDKEGRFTLRHVPTDSTFLLAALYDRGGDRRFDEDEDLWGFGEQTVRCPRSGEEVTVTLHLVWPDEPGDVAGVVTDSVCIGYAPPSRLRADGDSLRAILAGERDAAGFLLTPADSLARVPLSAAEAESLGDELARLDARLARAGADSLWCGAVIWVSAFDAATADSLPVAEVRSFGEYRFSALAAGTYRVRAYRDLDRNGRWDAGEPRGAYPLAIELKPGREITGLDYAITLSP
jgi:hypothetical protein